MNAILPVLLAGREGSHYGSEEFFTPCPLVFSFNGRRPFRRCGGRWHHNTAEFAGR
jgi:hypothetical protein